MVDSLPKFFFFFTVTNNLLEDLLFHYFSWGNLEFKGSVYIFTFHLWSFNNWYVWNFREYKRICQRVVSTTRIQLRLVSIFLDCHKISRVQCIRENIWKFDVFELVLSLSLSLLQCFFPQNLIANVKTPLFLLNAAYDAWQVFFFL